MQELKGSFVALVTPMKSNGEIDYPALKELVEWHIESGTHGHVYHFQYATPPIPLMQDNQSHHYSS